MNLVSRTLRRLGCAVLLVIWFVVLTLPCFAIALVFQREIVLTHSDIPGDELRVWLIQDIHNRGVAVTNSRRINRANNVACTVVDGRFFLWQGSPATSPHFCSCYSPQGSGWSSIAEGEVACQMAGDTPQATRQPDATLAATMSP